MNTLGGDPLCNCITNARGKGESIARIAAAAGVSTKTITSVINGDYFLQSEGVVLDGRSIRGILSSMTRLAIYFGLDPRAVADAYKFPQTDAIKAFIDQAVNLSDRNKENFAVSQNELLNQEINQGDLDLLSMIIEKVGGPILLSTALSILESRHNVRKKSTS